MTIAGTKTLFVHSHTKYFTVAALELRRYIPLITAIELQQLNNYLLSTYVGQWLTNDNSV